MGRALGGGGGQDVRQKRLAIGGTYSRAGQRGGSEHCVSETGEGAMVGKEAVVKNDQDHRKAKYYQDRIFTIGFSSLV